MTILSARNVHRAACIGFVVVTGAAHFIALRAHHGDATPNWIGTATIVQYGVATLLMVLAWRTHSEAGRHAFRWVMCAGLAARILLVPVDPYTSNDFERYLWDGRVALEGIDPYQVAPDDTSVAHLRPIWPTPPEHASLPTLYPPAALASFALAASSGPDRAVWSWKLLCGAASVVILLLCVPLLRGRGGLKNLPLVALSPLLVMEFGIGAHVDAFSTLALTAALLASTKKRWAIAGFLIGLGALFKLLPAVALLPIAWSSRSWRNASTLVVLGGVTILLGYAGIWALGMHPLGSSVFFFENWRFGAVLFPLAEPYLSGKALVVVFAAIACLGLLYSVYVARKDDARAVQVALATPLLLSPVIFPWYLAILVPVFALSPNAFGLAWISTLPLSYEVLNAFLSSGAWSPAAWPLFVVGGTLLLSGGWDAKEELRLRKR